MRFKRPITKLSHDQHDLEALTPNERITGLVFWSVKENGDRFSGSSSSSSYDPPFAAGEAKLWIHCGHNGRRSSTRLLKSL